MLKERCEKNNMSGIKKIANEKIKESLDFSFRQYLVGNLKGKQELQHIHDEDVEVGISFYKEFKADVPHIHREVTEYQFILEGYSEIKNLSNNEVIQLNEGDFYIVYKGTPYAQKCSKNTKIIFFKNPGINDKVIIEVDYETKKWLDIKI